MGCSYGTIIGGYIINKTGNTIVTSSLHPQKSPSPESSITPSTANASLNLSNRSYYRAAISHPDADDALSNNIPTGRTREATADAQGATDAGAPIPPGGGRS